MKIIKMVVCPQVIMCLDMEKKKEKNKRLKAKV
jgi:hypothetical protein